MLNAYHLYNIAHRAHKLGIPLLPELIKLLIFLIYNSSIPFECKIGRGTRFGYSGIGVVLHRDCVIGENVMISPQVTIGGRKGSTGRLPIIGNNVYIATGAKILGDVSIGEGAVIGANAVVIKSVPANSIAAGVPARIIKECISPEDYN